jgi:hypothetical protein
MCEQTDPQNLKRLEMAGVAVDTFSAYSGAKRARGEAKYAAALADLQAHEAQGRGATNAARSLAKTRKNKGSIRATLAARGFEVGAYGTAADLETATDLVGMLDAFTILDNSEKEAYGRRARSGQLRARADSISPVGEAAGTLIGDASVVARRWYDREQETA